MKAQLSSVLPSVLVSVLWEKKWREIGRNSSTRAAAKERSFCLNIEIFSLYFPLRSAIFHLFCSLPHFVRDEEAAGSNPASPTMKATGARAFRQRGSSKGAAFCRGFVLGP